MILVCPLCQTRYLVAAHLFAAGARQVRCARCKHGWKAETPKEIDVVAAAPPEPIPPPEQASPIPAGSNLPALAPGGLSRFFYKTERVALAAFVVLVLAFLIFDRQSIARRWAFMETAYNAVGLTIYYPGDGLEFDQVRSELKYDSGITKLILNGNVKNTTQNNQKVPPITAQALGPDGRVIQSWQIDAPTATLAPGDEAPFSSSLNAPKGTVVNVNLNFAEMKDDN
jgi:predicted Zn finger-like uncharacterized protein